MNDESVFRRNKRLYEFNGHIFNFGPLDPDLVLMGWRPGKQKLRDPGTNMTPEQELRDFGYVVMRPGRLIFMAAGDTAERLRCPIEFLADFCMKYPDKSPPFVLTEAPIGPREVRVLLFPVLTVPAWCDWASARGLWPFFPHDREPSADEVRGALKRMRGYTLP